MKGNVLIIIIVLVAVLAAGGFLLFGNSNTFDPGSSSSAVPSSSSNSGTTLPSNPSDSDSSAAPSGSNPITITSSGFSPSTLTINKGDTVTFVNQGSSSSWPASNVHPTHTSYPGSSIQKCGTAEANNIFDACHGLRKGESYSFTFNDVGSWRYHDHLRPSSGGTIVVR